MRGKAALAGLATALALAAPASASGPVQKLEGIECDHIAGVGTACAEYRVLTHISQTPSGRMAVSQSSRWNESFVGEGDFAECHQQLRHRGHSNYLLRPDENGDGLGETQVYHFTLRGRYRHDCSDFGLPEVSCSFRVKYLVIDGAVRQDRGELNCEPLESA